MAVTWQLHDSPIPSNADNGPTPVSAAVTPSSANAVPTIDHPTDDERSPLPTHGLQNVFTETILLGSDEEDEEIKFSYGTGPSSCSLPSPTSPHGFPGNTLVSPLSHHQFGFT